MAPFSKILSSRPSWLRVSIRGRPGENPTWRESAPRRRHSFRQRITELAAQWTRRATSFKDRSSSNSFSARLRRSESSSAEPFGRIWTSCTLEVYYCIILCEVNSLEDIAPRNPVRGTRPRGQEGVQAKAYSKNDPSTPQAWLPNRTEPFSISHPSMNAAMSHDFRPCVDSTAGDVVQLVRTLPCRWLEIG